MAAQKKVVFQKDDNLESLIAGLEAKWSNGERKLRAYPSDMAISATCRACGLERIEEIGRLVEEYGLGDQTLSQVSAQTLCLRASCGQPIAFDESPKITDGCIPK